jgi:predicted transcriptional regulator
MSATKTFTLPENLATRLEALAAVNQTPVDHILAEAVAHFLLAVEQEEKKLTQAQAALPA